LSSPPCDDGFTCLLFLGVHGTVLLQVDESKPQSESRNEMEERGTLEGRLGQPLQITALPLGAIGRDDGRGDGGGVTKVVAPSNLGYSVMGSENSQFPRYMEAFKRMVERHACLTSSDIARFFNSFDDEMYSYFDSRFRTQFNGLQARFLARAPQDPADFAKFDFTEKFLTFASDEMLKHDFNSRMQMNRKSAGLYWTAHNDSCIAEKLYCPGTHANKCSLYFPGVGDDKLRGLLALLPVNRFELQGPSKKPKTGLGAAVVAAADVDQADEAALCSGVSIASSSGKKLVLTITFENDPKSGFVNNERWKGISLDTFFRQIKRYLNYIFKEVEGFDLNGLMSRTCVIDTACANFSVSVPGQHVSIIGFDNRVGASAGAAGAAGAIPTSMLVDVHNVPHGVMGWWERKINLSSGTGDGDAAAYTHSRHRLSIPRDLVSYVPSGLVCVDTIKSVEPITDEMRRVVSVVYTYHDGRQETIAREPPSSGAGAAAGGLSDSIGAVCDQESQRADMGEEEEEEKKEGKPGGGGGRKPLHTTRRVRSLRNKSKTKRSNKIRGFRRRGVRRTRRKRTRRTLRR
jgi:hypothetical protein